MSIVQTVEVVILLLVLTALSISRDMRILQNNIQSIRASLPLLWQTVQKLDIDVILLQVVWYPSHGSINILIYNTLIVKLRKTAEGGGVAIITRRNVKVVQRRL